MTDHGLAEVASRHPAAGGVLGQYDNVRRRGPSIGPIRIVRNRWTRACVALAGDDGNLQGPIVRQGLVGQAKSSRHPWM